MEEATKEIIQFYLWMLGTFLFLQTILPQLLESCISLD